ncbi:SHOCT domain-containing protein [Microbacterium sp. NPDC077644]|uniref:SHOCT domain-containing protein n=1 Tax=Microbacterium sp. NPDC077644 TaxID=3155055 RepID=UPI00344D8E54
MDDALFDAVPGSMGIAFAIFGVLFVAAVIFIIVAAARNWKAAKDAGYDPLTMQTQATAQVLRSELLRPSGTPVAGAAPPSIEQRLAELDDLHARGVITDAEHAAARASALGA